MSPGTTDACDALETLRRQYGDRIAHVERLPARPAAHGEPAVPLHPRVVERMKERGIGPLYRHQADALDLLRDRRHVVVATGTASGKSLCYQIPIVETAAEGVPGTALLLFPTKALAHDQLRSLHAWLVPELEAAAYDGDTPNEERTRVRKRARVVVTNPDMLHVGILPNHQRWATFFTHLQYVVVDELHTLRGIFGSHVAHLLRRLRRICAYYGSSPTFCFASATIGNPGQLASELCGLPVETIDEDGSPRAERCFAVWERPIVDPEAGVRLSANMETARIVAGLVEQHLHSIAFTRSRKAAELVAAHVRDQLPDLADRVAAYRGGYLPSERRHLEEQLSSGQLLAVAATNALELGIDIGMLDAITLNGFPGTLASMWQQAGRAGRAGQRALAVLVAGDDQLDQYYATHPTELFTRELEPAVVNPANPFVAKPHLGCAAFEIPLADKDAQWFGDNIDDHVRELVHDGYLRPRGRLLYWAARQSPARDVSLRTGASVEYQLLEAGTLDLVGTVDSTRVFQVAHEGAIYLHQGRQYRVVDLDTRRHHAVLEPNDDEEYTQTREDIDLSVTGVEETAPLGRATAHLGTVTVQTDITAYQRKSVGTGEVIEVVDLDLPPRTLPTRASWYTIPDAVVDELGLETARLLGALHAAEHAMIGMLPMFTICDRWDVGGLSIAVHPDTELPTVFIYDGYPGGAGIAELAHACAARHVTATLELVRSCPCESGCPSCVQSPKCGNWNEYLDKEAAVALLEALNVQE